MGKKDRPPGPASSGELEAIARWTRSLGAPPTGVLHGPGDDVAWLAGRPPIALTIDTMVEGVHFRRSWAEPVDIGWRAATAALSDLAAARARPRGLLLSLSAAELDDWCDDVFAGVAECAAAFACPILGGDTTGSPGPAVLAITAVGEAAPTPLLRSGAEAGDLVLLSGPLGRQAWATEQLLLGEEVPWPRPRPRLDLLEALGPASAGIDISDGLLRDAGHLAEASGADVVLDRQAVRSDGVPEHCSLAGGEDWELLVTAPMALPGFTVVGRVEAGPGAVRFADGSALPEARGWEHGL